MAEWRSCELGTSWRCLCLLSRPPGSTPLTCIWYNVLVSDILSVINCEFVYSNLCPYCVCCTYALCLSWSVFSSLKGSRDSSYLFVLIHSFNETSHIQRHLTVSCRMKPDMLYLESLSKSLRATLMEPLGAPRKPQLHKSIVMWLNWNTHRALHFWFDRLNVDLIYSFIYFLPKSDETSRMCDTLST